MSEETSGTRMDEGSAVIGGSEHEGTGQAPQIKTVKVKPLLKLPLRARLRYWWMRRRMNKAVLAAIDEEGRRIEHEFLFGKPPHGGNNDGGS